MKQRGRRLLVWGVVLWVLAGAAYGTLRLTYGQRPAYVHVRWALMVDATSQGQIERAHRLTRGELREGRTWGYYLTDVSRDNIRGLVENPAVEDTHQIHRTAFRIWRTAPRSAYLTSRPAWIAAMLEFDPAKGLAVIAALMEARLGEVSTGEVCACVRTVRLDGVDVAEGQIIGLLDRQLVTAGEHPSTVLLEVLRRGVTDSTELVTLFWGQNVEEQEAIELCDTLADRFDGIEFELVQGGQPYYHYLISIE